MAGAIGQSIRLIFGLIRRGKKRYDLKHKLAEFDQAFLKMVTDPAYEDGRIHARYQAGLEKIREWHDVENRK